MEVGGAPREGAGLRTSATKPIQPNLLSWPVGWLHGAPIPEGQAPDRRASGTRPCGGHGWHCQRWCWPPAVSSVRSARRPEGAVGARERQKAGR